MTILCILSKAIATFTLSSKHKKASNVAGFFIDVKGY